jgi:ribose transport system substrate-binding protein
MTRRTIKLLGLIALLALTVSALTPTLSQAQGPTGTPAAVPTGGATGAATSAASPVPQITKDPALAKAYPYGRPSFSSKGMVPDEGTVKPVNKQPSKAMRIAVLGLENNPFWIPVKQGTLQANDELKAFNTTVEWIVPGNQHTAAIFGPAIDAAIAKQYDAIVTIAGDAGVAPYINKAVMAGIPVATFNSETATENDRLFFVGADLYQQGQTAGHTMCQILNGKGKVGIITGFFAVEAHELRRKGFEDQVKSECPGVTIVGRVENQDDGGKAFTEAKDFMTANPDLAAIYVTAGGPFGAGEAIQQAGKAGQVHEVCFDFVDETMQLIQAGVIDATIGQDPFAQGHDPAVRLFNYIVGGVVPPYGQLITRADVVTKANLSQFWSPAGGGTPGASTPGATTPGAATPAAVPTK